MLLDESLIAPDDLITVNKCKTNNSNYVNVNVEGRSCKNICQDVQGGVVLELTRLAWTYLLPSVHPSQVYTHKGAAACRLLSALLGLLTGSLCGWVCSSRLEQRLHICSWTADYRFQPSTKRKTDWRQMTQSATFSRSFFLSNSSTVKPSETLKDDK